MRDSPKSLTMPAIKKKWVRTNDIQGHKRNFTHKCSSCGHDKMIFRHSNMIPASQQLIMGKGNKYFAEDPCNIMAFKCERCSLMDRFIVDDTAEYIDKILKLRHGVTLYVPSRKIWKESGEVIKQRLKDLGYM